MSLSGKAQGQDDLTAIDRMLGGLAVIALTGIALIATVCCAPRPQAREPEAAPVPFCFAAVARFDGSDQLAVGCFSSPELCGNAQRRAVKFGGIAGVTSVGECRRK